SLRWASPPARLAIGFRTVFRSTESPMKRTLPSPITALKPPGWLLPALMSLKLPPPLYLTVRGALVTSLEPVQSLSQAQPRAQERSEPGDASRPVQAHSKAMSVSLVPSMMLVRVTPLVGLGADDAAPA